MSQEYLRKFDSFKRQTLFPLLTPEQQDFVRVTAVENRFTYQEVRKFAEACRDLQMWCEEPLRLWWDRASRKYQGRRSKKVLLHELGQHLQQLKSRAKVYPSEGLPKPKAREKKALSIRPSEKKIQGMCPVASEETVCCNLRTIDAVENCAFGCSYCTIQTFYKDEFHFDADFARKLRSIELDERRYYHFGTGQSSDSLVWGNRYANLDVLCGWAADNPNVLLEFKTKSNNIAYLLENEIPPNIVCSWSLNTPIIIHNEEHFTANLEQRIAAARAVADKGIKVSFHFHPIVYYHGWDEDYPGIAEWLLREFDPGEILFISFGSVTMIKPAMKKIRQNGHATKILQMEMVPDPHGKLTYPDEVKIMMFRLMNQAFSPWHDDVFFYLCMEKAAIWHGTFGWAYKNNELFEQALLTSSMAKVYGDEVCT